MHTCSSIKPNIYASIVHRLKHLICFNQQTPHYCIVFETENNPNTLANNLIATTCHCRRLTHYVSSIVATVEIYELSLKT